MYSKLSVAALAAALLAGSASAGAATIKNQCSSSVYLWTVINNPGTMVTIPAGQSYTDEYQYNSNGGGVSIKIATQPNLSGGITQFEYTLAGMLWYDISNINGYPFMASGLKLIPANSACRTVACEAGVAHCSAAYNKPDDNEATASCGLDTDTTLVLCSGNQGAPQHGPVIGVPSSSPATHAAAPSSSVAAPVVFKAAPSSSTSSSSTSTTPTSTTPTSTTPTSTTPTYTPPPPAPTTTTTPPPPETTSTTPPPAPSTTHTTHSEAPAPVETVSAVPVEAVKPAPTSSSTPPAPTTTAPATSAAPPATTAAPAAPANVDVFTTFVTAYYTVWDNVVVERAEEVKRAADAAQAEHVHKRGTHRHHFQRHGDNN